MRYFSCKFSKNP